MPLHTRHISGSQLTKEDIAQMYALRLSIAALREDVNEGEDFASVSKFIKKSQYVSLSKDSETGELKACFVVFYTVRQIQGKACTVVEPEYGYAVPALRGGHIAQLFARTLLRIKLRFWFRPIYIVGCGYPHSYISFSRNYAGSFFTLTSADIPAFERAVLVDFLQRKTGQSEVGAGLLRLNVVHTETHADNLERLSRAPQYADYLAQNPQWQEGYTLGFVVRVSWWTIFSRAKK